MRASGFPCPFCLATEAEVRQMAATAEDGAQLELRCLACDYIWTERP